MTEILGFAGEHPVLAAVALMFTYAAIHLTATAILRSVMVLARGWPPAHLDASGDMADEPDES